MTTRSPCMSTRSSASWPLTTPRTRSTFRMTPEVQAAVQEVRQTFADHKIEAEDESQGGAYVFVHGIVVGERYCPKETWFGFLIPFLYPRADVYPHFVDGNLCRVDKQPLGQGFSGLTEWMGKPAIQISRASKRWNPSADTAAGKLVKVVEWVRS